MIEATNRYFLPLAIAEETSAGDRPVPARSTLAKTRTGARSGFLVDAFGTDAFVLGVLNDVRETEDDAVDPGRHVHRDADGRTFGTRTREGAARPAPRRRAEQYTSVVIDESIVLKGYRKIHPGPQPELEIARFLATVGYENTPALYGFLEYSAPNGETTALAIVQQFVESQGDGWAVTLAYLERFFDRHHDMTANRDLAPVDETAGTYHDILHPARTHARHPHGRNAPRVRDVDRRSDFEPEPVTQGRPRRVARASARERAYGARDVGSARSTAYRPTSARSRSR